MKKEFEQFLIHEGYKEYTPSGHPSTVYNYCKCIDSICQWEHTDWNGLAKNAAALLPEYEKGGLKAHLGCKSHNTVISALRCFHRFISTK